MVAATRAVAAGLLWWSVGAGAAPVSIRVGPAFDEAPVGGQPTALWVDVTANGGPARGELRVPLRRDRRVGVPREIHVFGLALEPGETERFWLTTTPTWRDHEVEAVAELRGRGRCTARTFVGPLRQDGVEGPLVAVLGGPIASLERATRRPAKARAPAAGPPLPAQLEPRLAPLEPRDLPPDPTAYARLAALVVRGDALTRAAPAAQRAVGDWVRQGGHVIFADAASRGVHWQIRFEREQQVASYQRAGRTEWIGLDAAAERWLGLLLAPDATPPPLPWFVAAAARHEAVRLPGVKNPTRVQVSGFLLLYLIALIPLQFLLLKRLGRRQWAWVVTPLIVTGFSLWAYHQGLALKSQELVLSRVGAVQIESGHRYGRATSAVSLYTPRMGRYSLPVPRGTSRVFEMEAGDRAAYPTVDADSLEADRGMVGIRHSQGVPGASLSFVGNAWSAKVFAVEHEADLAGAVTVDLRSEGDRVVGEVRNGLPVALERPVIRIGDQVLTLAPVGPGAAAQVALPAPHRGSYDGHQAVVSHLGGFATRWFSPTAAKDLAEAAPSDLDSGPRGIVVGPGRLFAGVLYAWTETGGTEEYPGRGPVRTRELRLLMVRFEPARGSYQGRRDVQCGAEQWAVQAGDSGFTTLYRFTVPDVGSERLARLRLQAVGQGSDEKAPELWVWNVGLGNWERLQKPASPPGQPTTGWSWRSGQPARYLVDGRCLYVGKRPATSEPPPTTGLAVSDMPSAGALPTRPPGPEPPPEAVEVQVIASFQPRTGGS